MRNGRFHVIGTHHSRDLDTPGASASVGTFAELSARSLWAKQLRAFYADPIAESRTFGGTGNNTDVLGHGDRHP